MIQSFLFYGFFLLTVLGALGVVLFKHPVRAVLSLVFTLVCGAVLWLFLEVEFLALILVVVYIGAVMVLFLFVVMMLDVDQESQQKTYVKYWPLACLVAAVLFGLLAFHFCTTRFGLSVFPTPAEEPAGYSNIAELGMVLFTQYLYPFEVAGLLLLAGMVAAISLTFRGRKVGTKTQIISEQVRVKAADRFTMVDLKE